MIGKHKSNLDDRKAQINLDDRKAQVKPVKNIILLFQTVQNKRKAV